ncbi:MAG TPA: DUF2007 domain-containing protein [Solirubrobacteraceae bacterium]|nr:DUF2007 domain-containing protein [Solirubrobacteraceae bacterium]
MSDSDPSPTLKILTTVQSAAEAEIVVGDLQSSGIRAIERPGVLSGGSYGSPGSRDVYVELEDLERAREVLDSEPMSEDELIKAEEEDAAARFLSPPPE